MKTLISLLAIGMTFYSPRILAFGLPVAEDTSATRDVLTLAAGKASTLAVSSNQAALLRFDLTSLPAAVSATNIVSSRIKLYVTSAKNPGDLTASLITAPWTETVTSNTSAPGFDATTIAAVPAAKLVAKRFVGLDVTDEIVGFLDGTVTNHGFLLRDAAGQLAFASKEGPSQGPAPELEIEANLSQDTTGSGVFPGSLIVGGHLSLGGLIRQGSETGTAEPAGGGLITRRIQSTNPTAGAVVARTDSMTLERAGTAGGWRTTLRANSGNVTFVLNGIDAGGTPFTSASAYGPNPYPAVTNLVLDPRYSGGDLIYFHCIFGSAEPSGYFTEVTLFRSPNSGGTNWVGTLTSSYNQ
ncbi:MAG: DNRLRE domain-containing protein [Verrucomicrobiota bacterium]